MKAHHVQVLPTASRERTRPRRPRNASDRLRLHAAAIVLASLASWSCSDINVSSREAALSQFANINFQPAGSPVPAGYLADTGAPFANRGNGFAYGWNGDASTTMRDRNLVTDQRYDTLVHMQLYGT